ncbi:M56 family metallopeptidase [Flavobacterium sp. 5]|uniref:M56 family metallopeptidase n=1 Tax=Flavobacterium sp. 5 TaxID=2035199 RepID=UPI000C2C086F|nr:M56 family metallopeptidase [Flavobacterium sp. 5]PKB18401.1 beta-lactamase regulating signal transducer with metallopeptidase domain [Flavobacterium sp. 5]
METLFIYIAKSSGLLTVFYITYFLLLYKETFFSGNRWFLLGGLFTSAILPFLFYTKIIWVDPAPITNLNFQSAFIPPIIEKESIEINWNYLILAIYSIGFLSFLIKFAMDFYSLNSVLRGKKTQQQADFKFIDTTENIAPFSYFNYIVYNSSLYSATELENIIEHEKVHSEQNHTVDVLISRIFCILFWFNPIIWLYKKAITQNLEFIADSEASKKLSDKKVYQYILLKITTHENCIAITNHFYQSLIKKRIVMLNKNQSKKKNSWKYTLVIPALVAFVLLFQIEVIAKERNLIKKESVKKTKSIDAYKILKITTDQELKKIAEKVKSIHNVDVIISEIKRNSNNELTNIKVDIQKGTKEAQTIQIKGDNAIKDCDIIIVTEENGSKKINLITNNKMNNSTVSDDLKTEEKKVQNPKINTNVNVNNNNNNTKTDININTDTNTIVNINSKVQTKSSTRTDNSLIIIDGMAVPNHLNIDFNSLPIESIHIYNSLQAVFKYGNIGKNGVIDIVTKKDVRIGHYISSSDVFKSIFTEKSFDYKKMIIIIDGQLKEAKSLENLNPENVESVSCSPKLFDLSESEKATMISKYGENALNGIIKIKTKDKK